MGIRDANESKFYDYNPKDVYRALISAINSLPGYKIKDQSFSNMTLNVNKGMSMTSGGERIEISVRPFQHGAEVSIFSKTKCPIQLTSVVGNINSIFSALSSYLRNCTPTKPDAPDVNSNASSSSKTGANDTVEAIIKLDQLHNSGILTDEEFAAAKKRILNI